MMAAKIWGATANLANTDSACASTAKPKRQPFYLDLNGRKNARMSSASSSGSSKAAK
jgi:hypothetical protein